MNLRFSRPNKLNLVINIYYALHNFSQIERKDDQNLDRFTESVLLHFLLWILYQDINNEMVLVNCISWFLTKILCFVTKLPFCKIDFHVWCFALAGNLSWNKPCCWHRCKSTQHGKIKSWYFFCNIFIGVFTGTHQLRPRVLWRVECFKAMHILHALCNCTRIIGIVMLI